MSATDDLLQDHVFIRRLQAVIEKCYTLLYENKDVPFGDLIKIADMIEQFVDNLHHGKEENSYFPETESIDREEIRKFVIEHEFGRRIASEREQHGWIPGPVSVSPKCPLGEEEIKRLYRSNSQLTDEDIALLSSPLPSLDHLPSAKDFIDYFDQFKSLDKKIPEESKQYWDRDAVSVVALERLKHHLADAIEGVEASVRVAPPIVRVFHGGRRDDVAHSRRLAAELRRRGTRARRGRVPSAHRSRVRRARPAQGDDPGCTGQRSQSRDRGATRLHQ